MPKYEILRGQFIAGKGSPKTVGESISLTVGEAASHIANGDLKPSTQSKPDPEPDPDPDPIADALNNPPSDETGD